MKSSQEKKLSSVPNEKLSAGIIAMAVASLAMMCPVVAQQAPVPPTAPGSAAQPTSIRGTVSQYMMNPDGLVDGLLLSDNTIVRFPPHMGQQLVQALKTQDLVRVEGFLEFQGVIHAATITNANSKQSVVDTPPSPQNQPPALN